MLRVLSEDHDLCPIEIGRDSEQVGEEDFEGVLHQVLCLSKSTIGVVGIINLEQREALDDAGLDGIEGPSDCWSQIEVAVLP
ncbi:hypothetical protein AMTR_s00038p00231700 [Amborella trichopoda]|uniref:Uncharacterized protein n=1 Tax=Amborella trichopoda TaxID=13333 RepID=U5CX47_AMBTC|nr:hypothetical protein AMTR_s00038p00231700 [Amborella trichopoda]